MSAIRKAAKGVSTHSRPKAAGAGYAAQARGFFGFNSQPPEGGWLMLTENRTLTLVSTHSRPKAAGNHRTPHHRTQVRFNSQPPEGGWYKLK